MYPYYTIRTGLSADDIAAVRTLYAAVGTAPPSSPTPPLTPPSTPAEPRLAITSPTTGSSYTSAAATISLAGTASCADGIKQLTWANSSGGSGAAAGATVWSAGPVTLKAGQNRITVTAAGVTGGTASQSLTVTYTASSPPPPPKDTVPPTLTILSPPTTGVSTSASTANAQRYGQRQRGVVAVTWTDSLGNTGLASGTTQWTAGRWRCWSARTPSRSGPATRRGTWGGEAWCSRGASRQSRRKFTSMKAEATVGFPLR